MMATISDEEYTEMRRIFRECANHFRREEKAALDRASSGPASMVEAQLAQREAHRHSVFAAACEKYADPES